MTVDFNKNPEIVEPSDDQSISDNSSQNVERVWMRNRPCTTISLSKYWNATDRKIKLRKNSFNQSFINPAANYTAGMEYDEKRGWRIVIGCISKNSQNEKIGNVINELK